jgi:heme/copper-type cytochrome/quinol oxidase subunit 2
MKIMEGIDNAQYSTASIDTADSLTRVQILHPVACAIAFIAFLFALGAGICGSILSALVSMLAWIITLVVLITDFISWGIVKDKVNKDGSGSHARFGTGMWTELAAMILLFLGAFLVLVSCCGARRKNRGMNGHQTSHAGKGSGTGRRRFWQRKY